MTTFMAECFWPGVTAEQVAAAGVRARCATRAARTEGVVARYLGAILVPADEIAFCLFEAASLEEAARIGTRAAIPFERLVEIVRMPARLPEPRPCDTPDPKEPR